jgi:soluble cytochrome b562
MKRFLPCLTLLVALAGCSSSNDLHDAMEEMKEPFKTMRDSSDANQIKAELATFTTAVNVAKIQKVKAEDQASFDEGMKKLVDLTAQVEGALSAGNLEEAKTLLNKMADVRKEYHDKFGVGKK